MPQVFCQDFTQEFQDLQRAGSSGRGFEELLARYTENPETNIGALGELEEIDNKRQAFIDKFQAQVKVLLGQWHPKKDYHETPEGKEDRIKNFVDTIAFLDSGRVVLKNGINLYNLQVSYFPSVVQKVDGVLHLEKTNIKRIDYLEETGLIIATDTGITSAQRLRIVHGAADLARTQITSLPALEVVKGSLNLANIPTLLSLPRLRFTSGLNISNTKIRRIDTLEEVGANLEMEHLQNFECFPSLTTIKDALYLTNTKIDGFRKTFPQLFTIGAQRGGSITLSRETGLEAEIEALRTSGSLQFSGNIQYPKISK